MVNAVLTDSDPGFAGRLTSYRRQAYRQTPQARLPNLAEAGLWLNEVGLCLFQTKKGVELPSLYGAVAGSDQPAPRWGEHDAAYGQAWGWKDELLSSGRIFYGKALGDYRMFVSLDLFPYLFALSEFNYGGDESDYLELYADGKLSLTARNICEIVSESGPISTTRLRHRLGITGGAGSRQFERGLTELQCGLLIAPVGIARDNRWKYTFAYNTTLRQWPERVAAARFLRRPQAIREVLSRYLRLAGGGELRRIALLFGWSETALRHQISELAAGQQIIMDEAGGSVWLSDLQS